MSEDSPQATHNLLRMLVLQDCVTRAVAKLCDRIDIDTVEGWINNPAALAHWAEMLLPPPDSATPLGEKREISLLPGQPAVGHLRRTSDERGVFLPSTSGNRTIADSSDLFGYVHHSFNSVEFARPPTDACIVHLYEAVKVGNFSAVLRSFNCNLEQVAVSEEQLITYVERYHVHGNTYFLLRKDVVAVVSRRKDETLAIVPMYVKYIQQHPIPLNFRIVLPRLI